MSERPPDPPCPACGRPVPAEADDCPHCGQDRVAAARDRVRARFQRTKLLLTIGLMVAFLFVMLGKHAVNWLGLPDAKATGVLVRLAATVAMAVIGVFYARVKGRSGWWGLIGLLGCIGYFVLLSLEKECHRCGARAKDGVEECPSCEAPM